MRNVPGSMSQLCHKYNRIKLNKNIPQRKIISLFFDKKSLLIMFGLKINKILK
jgi:hypothetical protein